MSNDALRRPAFFWPRCGALGIGLLLVLVFLLAWYRFANHDLSFSSDHLYCLHFCDDAIHGRDLRGWHLPAAPYLFPDMVVLSAAAVLTSDVAAVLLLYDAVHYLLLLAVLMILFRWIGMGRREAFTTAALGLTLLLAVCFHPTYVVRNLLLLHPGNHMGCQLVGLAATAFVLRALKRGYHGLSAALLVLVGGLCGFSDHLLIVQFLVPICAAALLLTLCRLVPLRRTLLTILLLGSAAVLSMSKQTVLTRLGLVPMRLAPSFQAPGIDALKNFAATFWAAFHEQTLLFIALALHLAGAATAIVLWALRRGKTSGAESRPAPIPDAQLDGTAVLFVALVLFLAPLCNAAALLVTNMVNYSTLDRYLYTWLLLPFLCLALWPRVLPWRPLTRLVPVAVIALVMVRLLTFPDVLDVNRFGSRYPPLAQALDDMVRKHGRLRGLGDYWRAREMHYLTQEHVDVLPIVPWGMPWFHGYNPNAFLFDDRRDLSLPDYHFVIVPTGEDTGPDAEQMRLRFGEPAEIIAVEGHEIWRYDRLVNRQLELFLRAQVAQRLVEQKPFVGPSEPRNLARPKRNLTPWDARGNVQLAREQTLTIRFDQPVRGEMIDIAADFADEYMLWFFRSGRKLGKAQRRRGGVERCGAGLLPAGSTIAADRRAGRLPSQRLRRSAPHSSGPLQALRPWPLPRFRRMDSLSLRLARTIRELSPLRR